MTEFKLAGNCASERRMRPDWSSAGNDELPQDLRAWVDEATLVQMVLHAVQSVCEMEVISRRLATTIPAGLPRIVLSILAYSYAVGTYRSEEIEAQIVSDRNLRYLSAGARPSWHDLRRFRRQRRPLVHAALSLTLRLACRFSLRPDGVYLGSNFEPSDSFLALEPTAFKRTIETAHTAAAERINQAVRWDSIELDV